MQKKIGFIGLGLMGDPMSRNILKKGFPLTVWNRTPEKCKPLKDAGAAVASSPAALAKNSDVVILMVTAAKDVKEVLFGKDGVVEGARKGLTVIDMGTIGPTAAKEISTELAKKGIEYLDAPVTGSTPGAISGTLTIFIGGKADVFEEHKDVFEAMGTNIQYMGPTGSGQGIKLINNYIITASIAALSEGLMLSDALGLDKKRVAEVLSTVPAISKMQNVKLPYLVNEEFPLLFSLANMKKDVTLALEEAKRNNRNLPVLKHMQSILEEAMPEYSEEDFSAIYKHIKKK